MDNITASLADELQDVVKYSEMARHSEYGSMLKDIAREEMQHAKNLRSILEMEGKPVPDLTEEWRAARAALYGELS